MKERNEVFQSFERLTRPRKNNSRFCNELIALWKWDSRGRLGDSSSLSQKESNTGTPMPGG